MADKLTISDLEGFFEYLSDSTKKIVEGTLPPMAARSEFRGVLSFIPYIADSLARNSIEEMLLSLINADDKSLIEKATKVNSLPVTKYLREWK